MQSRDELTNFYYTTLNPVLENLEVARKKIKRKIIIFAIITLLPISFISFVFFQTKEFTILTVTLILYSVFFSWLYDYLVKNYKKEFKNSIIFPLIKTLDKNLNYDMQKSVSLEHFHNSKISTQEADRFYGNDYVHGKIKNINIEFSDIHAEKKHRDSDGSDSWETLFKGLFIVSDFNKKFQGQTVILPDNAQTSFGNSIGNWLQENNIQRDELVKMDDVAFEKEFVVYSTDQIEARYILSHTLMEKLVEFKEISNNLLYISFIDGHIYLAIFSDTDFFEPSIFRSLLKRQVAMEYINILHLAIGIVEELKLNQKLWSKC